MAQKSVNHAGTAQMTPCDGTPESKTWCCGSTKDCCNSEHAITLAQRLEARASTHTGSQLSNGAKAGIAVGVSVGVIVLMTFLFFVRRAERKKTGSSQHQHYDYRATGTTQETMGIPVDDLPSRSVTAKHELPA
ncbi:uncharacterized protein N7477_008000 [Penicillium maclennaniae]|uniref:uncharacterized protein n=1 Tax=Penicillium maclennaniae TaxID=1343394 RepID=UPI002541DD91|nr:uncharacterized protein N7477_008000 [Penicillium maclennaniae]KAJ5665552.1 hypothetical protein N7477_008000 [Penicillium maclennaniae]